MVQSAPARRPRRTKRTTVLIAALAVCCGAFGSTAGAASASLLPSCAPIATSTPFSPWGDANSYFLMPDGGFEAGASGWSLSGAAVADGNESFFVDGATDAHHLALTGNARVVSPTVCVSMGENTIRLFVDSPGVASSNLHVQAYVQNPLTGLVL